MTISIRMVSGSLAGREFSFEKELVRVGDSATADVILDPTQPDNGGARGRVIEVSREGAGYRVRSVGDRELSAQGQAPIDRLVMAGSEVRFGAWGPIFTVGPAVPAASATAPAPVLGDTTASVTAVSPPTLTMGAPWEELDARPADDSQARRPRDVRELAGKPGEKPVGEKTVYRMIEDALGRARGTAEAGFVQKSTVFVRELVSDTIRSSTRSLKIGLALTGAALVVLAAALAYNVWATRRTVVAVTKAADEGVASVRQEMGTRLGEMKSERDALAAEADDLGKKIGALEQSADASQAAVDELKGRLRDAEARRKELEARLARSLAALEADRNALGQELERLKREQAADRQRQAAELERLRREQAAAGAAAPAPSAPAPEPVQATPAPAPPPR